MTREQRRREHRFLDHHRTAGTVLLILYGLSVLSILTSVTDAVVGAVTGSSISETFIGSAAASLIVLGIHKWWFRPEFEGNLTGGRPGLGLKLCSAVLIYWAICLPLQFLTGVAEFGPPTAATIGISITAGMVEETVFRGLPLSYRMGRIRKESEILTSLLLSSVIFGLTHGINILAGADVGSTLFQIVSAAGIGCFLGAIYLRCGNLLPTMILHTVFDIVAFLDVLNNQEGVVVGGVTWFSWVDMTCALMLGAAGLWMIRPSKRAEILEVWAAKWRRPDRFRDPAGLQREEEVLPHEQ